MEILCHKKGRSLAEFSFESRISKYPCSWLIYSDSFKGLPAALKSIVLKRLFEVLTQGELPDKFIHLRKTRKAIHEILLDTHREYAETAK